MYSMLRHNNPILNLSIARFSINHTRGVHTLDDIQKINESALKEMSIGSFTTPELYCYVMDVILNKYSISIVQTNNDEEVQMIIDELTNVYINLFNNMDVPSIRYLTLMLQLSRKSQRDSFVVEDISYLKEFEEQMNLMSDEFNDLKAASYMFLLNTVSLSGLYVSSEAWLEYYEHLASSLTRYNIADALRNIPQEFFKL